MINSVAPEDEDDAISTSAGTQLQLYYNRCVLLLLLLHTVPTRSPLLLLSGATGDYVSGQYAGTAATARLLFRCSTTTMMKNEAIMSAYWINVSRRRQQHEERGRDRRGPRNLGSKHVDNTSPKFSTSPNVFKTLYKSINATPLP